MSTVGEMDELQRISLSCSQCATVNLPHRKFCAKCRAPLWESCLQCGELGEAGEMYCGAPAPISASPSPISGNAWSSLPHGR